MQGENPEIAPLAPDVFPDSPDPQDFIDSTNAAPIDGTPEGTPGNGDLEDSGWSARMIRIENMIRAERGDLPQGKPIPWDALAMGAAGVMGIGLPWWAIAAYRARKALKGAKSGDSDPLPAVFDTLSPMPIVETHRRKRKKRKKRRHRREPRPDETSQNVGPRVRDRIHPIIVESAPIRGPHTEDTRFINVESDHYQRAHERARQEIARKYPGAIDILEAEKSMTEQFVAGLAHE
jgi:hypothetical protein